MKQALIDKACKRQEVVHMVKRSCTYGYRNNQNISQLAKGVDGGRVVGNRMSNGGYSDGLLGGWLVGRWVGWLSVGLNVIWLES